MGWKKNKTRRNESFLIWLLNLQLTFRSGFVTSGRMLQKGLITSRNLTAMSREDNKLVKVIVLGDIRENFCD